MMSPHARQTDPVARPLGVTTDLGRHARAAALVLSMLAPLLQAPLTLADPVSELPPRWHDQLAPVAEADLTGAEPLMQAAIGGARAEVAERLTATEPGADPNALAAAYGRLGALLLLVEVEAQADICLRNAMRLQPSEFRWPYYAGYLAMLAGNLDQALIDLERARAIDPDYPSLAMRLGKVRLDRSELAEAQAAFASVRDVPELSAPAHYYLGQIAVLERRFEDAIPLLETALAADPAATEVHYPLAQAHRALGDEARARDHLDRFKLRAPEIADPLLDELQAATKRSLPAFKRAIHAVREGDYATAVEELRAGLEIEPENAAARVSHARVLYLVGRRDEAAAELERALALDPDQSLAHLLVGALAQQRGELESAVDAYRRVLALEPSHPGALYQLANLDLLAGRHAEAMEGYGRLLQADPAVAPAHVLGLVASARTGRPESEIAAALAARVETDPNDLQARYALGRLLAAAKDSRVRDPERALELANTLMARQPIPPHLSLLALAQAAAGQWDEAESTQLRLLATLGWMTPLGEVQAMHGALEDYQTRRLTQPAWRDDDPMLMPPPFDALSLFRDYPAITPY